MKKRSRFRTIFLVLLLLFVAIQFLPVDRSAPEVNPSQDFVAVMKPPEQLGALIKNACYDCHSHETEYPWYSYVAPVSLWLQGHIRKGREKVNFSIWTTYTAEDADYAVKEVVEMIEKKAMPLNSFTWTHPEARLSDGQRKEMVAWFQTLRTGASDDRRDDKEDGE